MNWPQTAFAAPAPQNISCFATALIAAKPLKPCDRGVFGALNLLLLLQRNRACHHQRRRLNHSQSGRRCFLKAHQNKASHRPACQTHSVKNHPEPAHKPASLPSLCHARAAKARIRLALFRYRFNSNKARQIVRWSRFRSAEFAPVFAAELARHPRRCQLNHAQGGRQGRFQGLKFALKTKRNVPNRIRAGIVFFTPHGRNLHRLRKLVHELAANCFLLPPAPLKAPLISLPL